MIARDDGRHEVMACSLRGARRVLDWLARVDPALVGSVTAGLR
jgi:hypothetical protein